MIDYNPTDEQLRAIADAPILDRRDRRLADLARLVLREREELAAWRAECDKVGVPYDPPGLVRHHRGNAAVAAGCDALRLHVLPAVRRAEQAEAALARVEALCGEADKLWSALGRRTTVVVQVAAVRAAIAGDDRCDCLVDYRCAQHRDYAIEDHYNYGGNL